MNKPEISFPTAQAALKVRRSKSPFADALREPAELNPEEARHRLEQDSEALRLQEQNLHAYEMHLREWQTQLDQAQQGTRFGAPSSLTRFTIPSPQMGESTLQDAWTKLHRARALLEVEQKHVVDDRLAQREQEKALKQREETVVKREERIAALEQRLAAPAGKGKIKDTTVTRSPFAVAKSMLGLKA
ncbi:MAG: hypothetical protein KA257_07590 [Opitutaceae bacterium]|nr:hypothetical protein [Opitutaceae bacterium]MBP9913541.1 hypothetical protein [Opitutaceae bacterium]